MKSVMQEASSVIKAIEKGWETAGKPKEFSVKVFEEPKKNFIGITVQSAKIGIFFSEKLTVPKDVEKERTSPRKAETVQQRVQQPLQRREIAPKPIREPREYREHKEPREVQSAPTPFKQEPQKEAEKTQKIMWTPEMLALVNQWVSGVLKAINAPHVTFSSKSSHYQLVIEFNQPLLAHDEKEQQLLRSFSLLLIQTLRHAFKRPLRGFKIMMVKQA